MWAMTVTTLMKVVTREGTVAKAAVEVAVVMRDDSGNGRRCDRLKGQIGSKDHPKKYHHELL